MKPVPDLARRARAATRFRRAAPWFDHVFTFRCKVRILVVTDSSSGGFGTAGFHLGTALAAIQDDPWSHVEFEFTRAHRGSSAEAGVIDDLRFDAHDLSGYDQVWLFGIETDSDPLSDSELRALSTFMDDGGGVFATGDHEDLGKAMCAEVPRVRSMRRWYHDGAGVPFPGPDGEAKAPDQTGGDQHDTVVDPPGPSPGSQTDIYPQTIRPRYYLGWTWPHSLWALHRHPHPVLCGPEGVITRLPDHMHEGLCEVPADLTRSYTFDGATFEEYPAAAGGVRPAPEVIAWATNQRDGDEFGVIAAYDGHRADVGRVLVDATWHHWFNINLDAYADSDEPEAVEAWDDIRAYLQNVAAWLCPPGKQTCLKNGGWLIAILHPDLLITFRKQLPGNPLTYYWQLGSFAKDALGRIATRCQSTIWLHDVFKLIEWPHPWFLDPFAPHELRADPGPMPPMEPETLMRVVAGAALHELMSEFGGERDLDGLVHSRSKELTHAATRGARAGLRAAEARLREQLAGCEHRAGGKGAAD